MTYFWIGFGAIVLWGAIATTFIVWSRRETWARICAAAFFVLTIPIGATTYVEALGHHRPQTWEQIRKQTDLEFVVLAHKIQYREAIYLYLDQDGEPLALVLPWDVRVAEALEEAHRRRQEGERLVMRLPYWHGWDDRPNPRFDLRPQPRFMPDKDLYEPPMEYGRES